MQTRKIIAALVFMSGLNAYANEEVVSGAAKAVETPVVKPQVSAPASINTFDRLLQLQSEAEASALEAKIRVNNTAGMPAGRSSNPNYDTPPVDANPLLNASQRLLNSEPTLEAIWGLAGREVAEINYKGQRMAVSMRSPVVSKEDGWELSEIQPFQVVLIQKKGKKGVVNRKEIPLNWQGHIGGVYPTNESSGPSKSNVPGIGGMTAPRSSGMGLIPGSGPVNQALSVN